MTVYLNRMPILLHEEIAKELLSWWHITARQIQN